MRMKAAYRLLVVQNRRLGRPLDETSLEDVAQDAVLAMLRRLPEYEGRASLKTWIYRFCFLQLMNAARKRQRLPSQGLEFVDPGVTESPSPAEDDALHEYLKHLTQREAEAVRLKHVEDLDMATIAETLGIATSSAKTHYYRALEKLRGLLEEVEP